MRTHLLPGSAAASRLAALFALALGACQTARDPLTRTDGPPRVSIIFGSGGRGDRAFNDGAARGADSAALRLGVPVRYYATPASGQLGAVLERAAADSADLVICIGFMCADDLVAVARRYPQRMFVGIDLAEPRDVRGNPVALGSNVTAVVFQPHDAAALAGALAGQVTRTKRLGFLGGMRSEAVWPFEQGFVQGVRHTCPACTVDISYIGTTPDAFGDPAAARRLARALYEGGADIVFHAAGGSGAGVFQAARELGGLVIGADVDQAPLAPGQVLTSVLKRVDVAVYNVIAERVAGRLQGGLVYSRGLADGAVGLADVSPDVAVSSGARQAVRGYAAALVGKK